MADFSALEKIVKETICQIPLDGSMVDLAPLFTALVGHLVKT